MRHGQAQTRPSNWVKGGRRWQQQRVDCKIQQLQRQHVRITHCCCRCHLQRAKFRRYFGTTTAYTQRPRKRQNKQRQIAKVGGVPEANSWLCCRLKSIAKSAQIYNAHTSIQKPLNTFVCIYVSFVKTKLMKSVCKCNRNGFLLCF